VLIVDLERFALRSCLSKCESYSCGLEISVAKVSLPRNFFSSLYPHCSFLGPSRVQPDVHRSFRVGKPPAKHLLFDTSMSIKTYKAEEHRCGTVGVSKKSKPLHILRAENTNLY